jgi:hypothetical protein
MEKNENARRNQKILELRKNELALGPIGKEVNLSGERVRQIIEKSKYLDEQKRQGTLKGLGLSTRAVNTVTRITKKRHPTSDDLRNWISSRPSEWELDVLSTICGGRKTLEEIRAFAKSHNILPKPALTLQDLGLSKNAENCIMKSTLLKAPTLNNLREWINSHPSEWKPDVFARRFGGRKTQEEIKKFLVEYDVER